MWLYGRLGDQFWEMGNGARKTNPKVESKWAVDLTEGRSWLALVSQFDPP